MSTQCTRRMPRPLVVVCAVLLALAGVFVAVRSYTPAPPVVQLQRPATAVTPSPEATGEYSLAPSPATLSKKLPAACYDQTTEQFAPTSMTIVGEGTWPVVGVPRDENNVPDVANVPLWSFDWDAEGIPPNYGSGSYWGGAHRVDNGDSLGNLVISRLDVGDIVTVHGATGQHICLEVLERITVPVDDYPYARVFDYERKQQQYVLDICDGTRLGPFNWSHATLFFLEPVK